MKHFACILFTLITLFSCQETLKVNDYEIMNIIAKHHFKAEGISEKFVNKFDSVTTKITYNYFKVIPRESKILSLETHKNELTIKIKNIITDKAYFKNFFDLKDSLCVKKQISKVKFNPINQEEFFGELLPVKFVVDTALTFKDLEQISLTHKSDIMFIDKPIYNCKKNKAILGAIYFQNGISIHKLYQLNLESKTNKWEPIKVIGYVLGYHYDKNEQLKLSNLGTIDRSFNENW